MTREPVSVVILGWNAWDSSRACLDSLRPTLGPRDEVVFVDNGSVDVTPTELRRYPWLRVISNASNLGFAVGSNQGVSAAANDIVILLNNDTVVPPGWIERLVRPLGDPGVAAVGPRSNFVSGDQLVRTGYGARMSEMMEFAQNLATENRGQTSQTTRLVGFCVALRRSAFLEIGGFDEGFAVGGYEDDDLCARLREEGYVLCIAHDAFVHHDGHRTFNANGVDWAAQEIANRTVFLEKRRTRRRRSLLAACVTADRASLTEDWLTALAESCDEVIISAPVLPDGAGKNGQVRWVSPEPGMSPVEGRNRLAEEASSDWLLWILPGERVQGDHEELRMQLRDELAADVVMLAAETGVPGAGAVSQPRITRRSACRWAITEQGPTLVRSRGSSAQLFGRQASGCSIAAPVASHACPSPGASDSTSCSVVTTAAALAAAGRPSEAADLLHDELCQDRAVEHVPTALSYLRSAERHPSDLFTDLTPRMAIAVVAEVVKLPADVADATLEELYDRLSDSEPILLGAAAVARHLDVRRALQWSARLRMHGLASACPLMAHARNEHLDVSLRLATAAVAYESFGDEEAHRLATVLTARLAGAELESAWSRISVLCPSIALEMRRQSAWKATTARGASRTGPADEPPIAGSEVPNGRSLVGGGNTPCEGDLQPTVASVREPTPQTA